MIDYIKICVKDLNPSILETNTLLIFEQRNISNEGFLFPIMDINNEHAKDKKGNLLYKTPYKNAFYNGLEFRIYETGTIHIKGSLHKYYNSGAHNFNDFNFNAFLDVLNDFKKKFNIDIEKCILKSLEIGINIKPPKPTKEILNYCFLHKTQNLEYRINSDEGKYKQCERFHYIIKLYDKALHYKKKGFEIDSEILRFEIKYLKMERINKLGIYNLNDIAKFGFKYLQKELLTEWKNVLFYDSTIKTKSKRINNFKNPLFWDKLINNNSKSNFYKQKEYLKKITLENSERIHEKISQIMKNKIDILSQKGASFDTLNIRSIHTPDKLLIIAKNNNICEVTKVNISMQKDNSLLLSHTGLKYYYKTDRKTFNQIKRRYLSKRWLNSNIETQIKEIAHNIRNQKSNLKTKQNRLYQSQQINLLSLLEM